MFLSLTFIVCNLLLLQARAVVYSTWAANSAIARKQGNGLSSAGAAQVSYEHGEFQYALRRLYETTGNATYYDYIKAGADTIVYDNGTVHGNYQVSDYTLDPVRTGPTFLYLYAQTKAAKWKTAADTYKTQLNGHPRTAQSQFWHKLIYKNQGWLDGIYMGDVFYAEYIKAFQNTNTTAWTDVVKQFTLMYTNTKQASGDATNLNLLYHGYDYSKTAAWASSDRGHSPEVWDRALGWYMMALVDIIEILPASGKEQLLAMLRELAPAVRDAADPSTGVWWLVMTQPGREKNYFESSGAAMFVYSLLKGVRLGYIPDADGSIVAAAKKAYVYATKNWVVDNGDGTMDWKNTVSVGSLTTGGGTYDYYVAQTITINDLKGLSAFVLASLEYEKL